MSARFLRAATLAALLAAGCVNPGWPLHDAATGPMLAAAGFRVARAADGPPPSDLRPGRVARSINGSVVRYFYREPGGGALLTGDEDAYMRYEQLRIGRRGGDEPAVFLGFSYGSPVGF